MVFLFLNKKGKLSIQWNHENNYIMPKIQNIFIGRKRLTKVFFSLQEVDDTKKRNKSWKFKIITEFLDPKKF